MFKKFLDGESDPIFSFEFPRTYKLRDDPIFITFIIKLPFDDEHYKVYCELHRYTDDSYFA